MYVDGTYALWKTTTFSFEDPLSVAKFMGSLNLARKASLTNLRLRVLGIEHVPSWNRVLRPGFVKKWRSLETLHLEYDLDRSAYDPSYMRDNGRVFAQQHLAGAPEYSVAERLDHVLAEPFALLRMLPLKIVTAFITSNMTSHVPCPAPYYGRCPYGVHGPEDPVTLPEKSEAVERLCTMLLCGGGTKAFREEVWTERRAKKVKKQSEVVEPRAKYVEEMEKHWRRLDEAEVAKAEARKEEKDEKAQARNARRAARKLQNNLITSEEVARMSESHLRIDQPPSQPQSNVV